MLNPDVTKQIRHDGEPPSSQTPLQKIPIGHAQFLFHWIIMAACISLIAASSGPRWIEVEGGAWQLDANRLSEVQSALKAALPTADGGRLREWDAYTFQYQGKRAIFGGRYVFVNAFCGTERDYAQMRVRWVEVFDGGTCFFHVEYDLQTKQLRHLSVNGEA